MSSNLGNAANTKIHAIYWPINAGLADPREATKKTGCRNRPQLHIKSGIAATTGPIV